MGWGFPSSQLTRPMVSLFPRRSLGELFSRIRLSGGAGRLKGESVREAWSVFRIIIFVAESAVADSPGFRDLNCRESMLFEIVSPEWLV